jgi:hypothetical protein
MTSHKWIENFGYDIRTISGRWGVISWYLAEEIKD